MSRIVQTPVRPSVERDTALAQVSAGEESQQARDEYLNQRRGSRIEPTGGTTETQSLRTARFLPVVSPEVVEKGQRAIEEDLFQRYTKGEFTLPRELTVGGPTIVRASLMQRYYREQVDPPLPEIPERESRGGLGSRSGQSGVVVMRVDRWSGTFEEGRQLLYQRNRGSEPDQQFKMPVNIVDRDPQSFSRPEPPAQRISAFRPQSNSVTSWTEAYISQAEQFVAKEPGFFKSERASRPDGLVSMGEVRRFQQELKDQREMITRYLNPEGGPDAIAIPAMRENDIPYLLYKEKHQLGFPPERAVTNGELQSMLQGVKALERFGDALLAPSQEGRTVFERLALKRLDSFSLGGPFLSAADVSLANQEWLSAQNGQDPKMRPENTALGALLHKLDPSKYGRAAR